MSEAVASDPLSRVLDRIGVGRLGNTVPGDPGTLVTFALLVVVFELGVLQTARVLAGYQVSFADNPLWLLRQPALLGAALATTHLHGRYADAVDEMALVERTDGPGLFTRLVSPWLAWSFVAVGTGFTLVNAVGIIGLPELLSTGGLANALQFLVVIPFGYAPVMAAFLATYASIEVAVPGRLASSDVGLYYLDPEELGGMRPIGELVKLAYYYLLAGLVIYAVALYGPYVLGGYFAFDAGTEPGLVANAGFTAVWIASVATMVYGIHRLHRFMRGQKREALQRLDALARDYVEDPWDVEGFEVPDEDREHYEDVRQRVQRVSATREYPATFTMWAQLSVGVMIPKAVQLGLSAI